VSWRSSMDNGSVPVYDSPSLLSAILEAVPALLDQHHRCDLSQLSQYLETLSGNPRVIASNCDLDCNNGRQHYSMKWSKRIAHRLIPRRGTSLLKPPAHCPSGRKVSIRYIGLEVCLREVAIRCRSIQRFRQKWPEDKQS